MSPPLPTAILLDPNDGCLTIARKLVKRGVEVHVLARPRSAYVTRSRGVHAHILEALPAGEEDWLALLGGLAQRGPGVVLTGSDNATEMLVRNRARIPPSLLSFESPESAHLLLMDKTRLYELTAGLGLRVPWSHTVGSAAELEAIAEEAEYPCIVKPSLSHVGKLAGDYGTVLARSAAELRDRALPAIAEGVQMLVSEYVPGGEDELEGAVLVRRADGSYPLMYGRRKVRQFPPHFGQGTLTRAAQVPETEAIARQICDAASFAGVASLEAKRSARTGERVLIEINVRVVQSFGLGDACGVDAAWRLYATLAGLPLAPQPAQRDGAQVLSPGFDLLAVMAGFRNGELSPMQVLRSYRGTRDLSVLDPRDPLPGIELGSFYMRSKLAKRRAKTAN